MSKQLITFENDLIHISDILDTEDNKNKQVIGIIGQARLGKSVFMNMMMNIYLLMILMIYLNINMKNYLCYIILNQKNF